MYISPIFSEYTYGNRFDSAGFAAHSLARDNFAFTAIASGIFTKNDAGLFNVRAGSGGGGRINGR